MEEVQRQRTEAEIYMADLEERDFTVPSGAVFRIAGIGAEEFGELLGTIPGLFTLDGSEPSDETAKQAAQRRQELIWKAIYERCCRGLVGSDGTATPIPYAKVKRFDAIAIANFALGRSGLGTERAEQVRRSLRAA